jgi:LPS-assembly protein
MTLCACLLILCPYSCKGQQTDVPSSAVIPSPSLQNPLPLPSTSLEAQMTYESAVFDGTKITAANVSIKLGEYTLTGEKLEGDFDGELIFSGHPKLTYREQTLHGTSIHFFPKTRSWKIEGLKTALSPQFLQGRLLSPLYLTGKEISRDNQNPLYGNDIKATTCDKTHPDYSMNAKEIKVEPGKRITLKQVSFILWNHKLITLPTILIPLDNKPRSFRVSHPPQVGNSPDEGWFVKSSYDYLLSDRVPGLLRLDLMQKKGIGLGIEQDWKLLKDAGLLALYAIPAGGTGKNFTGRFSNTFQLGGGQTLAVNEDFQRQSFLTYPDTSAANSRLTYNYQGTNSTSSLSLAQNSSSSSGFTSTSTMANLQQGMQLGHQMSLRLNSDYSSFVSTASSFSQRNDQLSAGLSVSQQSSNYILEADANRTFISTSGNLGVEKLPEINLSNYRFTQGALSEMPLTLSLSAGQYTEGNGSYGVSQGNVTTDRAWVGMDLNDSHWALSNSSDLDLSAGFRQYFYGDGYAQYLLKDDITLTQRWNHKSGLHLKYSYQRPEGGTPFQFDRNGAFHTLTADVGMLDDSHFQLSAQAGYDLAQSSYGGLPAQPWQTVSANMLFRPLSWIRNQSLFSFDPNSGRFLSVTNDFRIKAPNKSEFVLSSIYDPTQHKFGAMNSYFNTAIGRDWRVVGLLQYNGYLGRFESRNLQIVHDMHCLEASLTYTENPYGFRNDRQIYFSIRIKAFPFYRAFGVGQFGQATDTSFGQNY